MTIDEIRKLSKQYDSGIPPKPKKQAKSIQDKHKYRIDIRALALKLTDSVQYTIRNHRLQVLHFTTYKDYIQSSHWIEFRLFYTESLKSNKCEIDHCTNNGVILHHRSYLHLGNENFDDVFLVCVSCHHKIHKEVKRIITNRKRNKEILGGCHNPLGSPQDNAAVPLPDSQHLPWGGLFSCRLVAANTKSAEL